MTEAGLRAAIDAGAAAVVAKSAGDSAAARRQLGGAEYATLGPDWSINGWDPGAPGTTLLNRSGLVDAPFDEWSRMLARLDRWAAERGAYVIGSVLPDTAERAPALAARMQDAGLRWIELNISAPHATEAGDRLLRADTPAAVAAITGAVRAAVDVTLTVKLTSETADVIALAAAARDAGADVVGMCGRRMGFLPDPETHLPVLGTFGRDRRRLGAAAHAALDREGPAAARPGAPDRGDGRRALRPRRGALPARGRLRDAARDRRARRRLRGAGGGDRRARGVRRRARHARRGSSSAAPPTPCSPTTRRRRRRRRSGPRELTAPG